MAQEVDVIVIEEVEYLPSEESDTMSTEDSKKLDKLAMKGAKKAGHELQADKTNVPGNSLFTK
jgi:hypothetical protein